MFFNSWIFIFCFLPAFLVLWQTASIAGKSREETRLFVLLAFSLLFYSFWGLFPLILLLIITLMNYALGQLIYLSPGFYSHRPGQKSIFVFAIIMNLLPLIWFKYSLFILSNLALVLNTQWQFTPPELPPGISFYTFIQIAWLCGIYQDKFKPGNLLQHTIFCSNFMYVLSGPIVRQEQMTPQYDRLVACSSCNLAKGFALFTIGLAKKVILADSIGFYADAVFNAAEKGWPLSAGEAWIGSFCYTFQLYFDFSGYTDMAIGIALMIGLVLPENFNSPYKATGIVDFWRRWHITLSTWLRDFLYIPMGGNRHGKLRQYRNLFLTMLIGGIWHGAGWTYVVWGALHGLMLGINHFFRAVTKGTILDALGQRLPARLLSILFTFLCLNICWVVFRAFSLDGAFTMYRAMFNIQSYPVGSFTGLSFSQLMALLLPNNYLAGWQPFALVCICTCICWFFPNSKEILHGRQDGASSWLRWQPTRAWAYSLALVTLSSLALLSRHTTFLYFQF